MSIKDTAIADVDSSILVESSARPPVEGEERKAEPSNETNPTARDYCMPVAGYHQVDRDYGPAKMHVWSDSCLTASLDYAVSSKMTEEYQGVTTASPCCSPLVGDCGEEVGHRQEFEAQGSADGTPPFTENGTAMYLKWAQNLHNLLSDREGVELFQKYLTQEKCNKDGLDFWFACEGLRKAKPGDVNQLIKLIFKRFIRSSRLVELGAETRKSIAEKIEGKVGMDQTIFDSAQREMEEVITRTTYPNFLKSDTYLEHVRSMQGSVGCDPLKPSDCSSSGSSSSSGTSRYGLEILPTLHEEVELQVDHSGGSLMQERMAAKQRSRFYQPVPRFRPETRANCLQHPSRVPNPYHIKYAAFLPSSAQDSELQSLSSDAQTDDTLSLTDSSSLDCGPSFPTKNQLRKQQRIIKKNARLNKDPLAHAVIPRTQLLPKETVSAQEPDKFAAILIEKLNRYRLELEAQDKFQESLQKIELEDTRNAVRSFDSSFHNSSAGILANLPPLLLTAAMKFVLTEESDQSILDQHVSRVWDDSAHGTPSRSPGRFSPPPRVRTPPLDRRRSAPTGQVVFGPLQPSRPHASGIPSNGHLTGYMQNPYQQSPAYSHVPTHYTSGGSRHKKERDTYSSDSGTVHDFTPDGESMPYSSHPAHVHRHVHHHHVPVAPPLGSTGTLHGMAKMEAGFPDAYATFPGDHQQTRRSREPIRRNSSKKTSTDSSSSCIDSGVSMAYDSMPSGTSTYNRVSDWMLNNEKYSYGHVPDSEKDSSTRHKKSSHSSISTTSPIPSRSSHAKKPVSYNVSLAGSLERGSLVPRSGALPVSSLAPGQTAYILHEVQPANPLAQDLSMPILPPPDTTTQLMEARRRLEDQARAKQAKPRACSSSRAVHEVASRAKTSKVAESAEEAAQRKSNRKSSGLAIAGPIHHSSAGTPGNDVTIVVYCLPGETVPYRTKLPGKIITLRQFKSLLNKKGNFRFFFKKASNEFETGVVNEEISDDSEVLPLWEGKIYSLIESLD